MKKFASLLLSGLLALSALPLYSQNRPMPAASNTADQIDWCESYSDTVRRAQNSSKPVFILFTGSTWCPACMKLERHVLSKPEFIRAVGNKFEFYKAEFPAPGASGMANSPDKFLMDRYHVDAFPTMVVIDSSGRQLFTVKYRQGNGPAAYAQEINQKLSQYQGNRP